MKRLIWLMALMATTLLSDDTIVYKMHDTDQSATWTMQYQDSDHIKIMMKDDNANTVTYYLTDGKRYMVNAQDGEQPTVFDMDEMGQLMKSMGLDKMVGGMGNAAVEQADPKYIKTNQTKRVSGYMGKVWYVEYTDGKDKKRKKEKIVVTNDRDISRSVKNFFKAMGRMIPGAEGIYENITQLPDGYVWIETKDSRFQSYSDERIASSTFELPKNATMQSFGQLNSFFSGRHSENDAQEDSTDDESAKAARRQEAIDSAEEKTKDVVGDVVNSVFDSLF